MRLPPFDYYEPRSLWEACFLLHRFEGRASPLAGGTNLLVQMKLRRRRPEALVNLKRIPGLSYVRYGGGGLWIGALTTINDLVRSEVVRERFTALWEAAKSMAFPAIRNVATVGGNLCNAAPTADLPPPLIALGAEVNIIGLAGSRRIPLTELYAPSGGARLEGDEVLTEVFIPEPPLRSSSTYFKQPARTREDVGVASVAVHLALSGDGGVEGLRLVVGAATRRPTLVEEAEEVVKARGLTADAVEEAADAASRRVEAWGGELWSLRGPLEYRREVVRALARRALLEVARRLGLEVGRGG